jgi:hypothetical protein
MAQGFRIQKSTLSGAQSWLATRAAWRKLGMRPSPHTQILAMNLETKIHLPALRGKGADDVRDRKLEDVSQAKVNSGKSAARKGILHSKRDSDFPTAVVSVEVILSTYPPLKPIE